MITIPAETGFNLKFFSKRNLKIILSYKLLLGYKTNLKKIYYK